MHLFKIIKNDDKSNKRLFFLFDTFPNDEKFYIISKTSILVTDDSEIKIGEKFQFVFPNDSKDSDIKMGKLVMQSSRC